MINPHSMARSILTTKSTGVAHCREMGLRNCGPWSPERRLKMAAALYALNVLSPAARRVCRVERRSRWLTNCIVERDGHKTFDLEGIDPLTGRSRFTSRCRSTRRCVISCYWWRGARTLHW
jgi:hypothetical protein